MNRVIPFVSAVAACLVVRAQEPAPQVDPTAIAWHLPGEFAAARERARKEKRLLLVKGISFGIDAEGARCATKGKW